MRFNASLLQFLPEPDYLYRQLVYAYLLDVDMELFVAGLLKLGTGAGRLKLGTGAGRLIL